MKPEVCRERVHSLSDRIWITDEHWVVLEVSTKPKDVLGYEQEEILGRPLFDSMPPEEARRVRILLAGFAREPAAIRDLVSLNRHKDGHWVYLQTRAVPWFDKQGVWRGYYGMDLDISATYKPEDTHAEDTWLGSCLAGLLQRKPATYPEWLFALAEAAATLTSSPIGCLGGYDERGGFLTDLAGFNALHPEDTTLRLPSLSLEAAGVWGEALRQRQALRLEFASGPEVFLSFPRWRSPQIHRCLEIPVFYRDRLVAWVVTANKASPYREEEIRGLRRLMDLAWQWVEQRKVEDGLREQMAQLNALIASARDAIIMADDAGRITFWNVAAEQILGWTEQEAVGQEVHALLAPAYCREAWRAGIARFAQTGQGMALRQTLELSARHKLGNELEVELSVSAFCRGDRWWSIGILRDISARKRAEEMRLNREAQYRQIVETANEGMMVLDQDFKITFVNHRMVQMLGYESSEMLGQRVATCFFEADREDYVRRMEVRRLGRAEQYEIKMRRKDGEPLWVMVSAAPTLDAAGRFTGCFSMHTDISERKRAAGELLELSSRLLRLQDEERRRIARELHDSTAQKLAALNIHLSLVKTAMVEIGPAYVAMVAESVDLARDCMREIRTLSYLMHPPLLEELGLADSIREYADGFAERSGIRVDLELPADLSGLSPEAELALFRVLQESLSNIHRHSGSKTASIRLQLDKKRAQLEVSDSGRGISGAAQNGGERCGSGKMGVGIAGMRERLRQLGGYLELDSQPRRTTVRAIIPVKRGGKTP